MEGPISFWGYKEQESNLVFPEHNDDDDFRVIIKFQFSLIQSHKWIGFLRTENNQNWNKKLRSYRAENTSSTDYENKSVLENNCCLLWGTYKTY